METKKALRERINELKALVHEERQECAVLRTKLHNDSGAMTEVKRDYLDLFCHSMDCWKGCPLHTKAHRCGRGTSFLIKMEETDEYEMTKDEIDLAFEVALKFRIAERKIENMENLIELLENTFCSDPYACIFDIPLNKTCCELVETDRDEFDRKHNGCCPIAYAAAQIIKTGNICK